MIGKGVAAATHDGGRAMSAIKLHDDERSFREGVARDLGSFWVNAYLGLYLTPDERDRFRRLDPWELAGLILFIKRMRRRGFDPASARAVRRAALAPGEPDLPVSPRAAAGALYGPPVGPPTPPPPPPDARPDPPTTDRPKPDRARGRRKRPDDPGQRLLPFMTPTLLTPD